jgi:hypothetical protein
MTIDGPSLFQLKDLTFTTKSSVPYCDYITFMVRGLKITEVPMFDEGGPKGKKRPLYQDYETFHQDGHGHVRLEVSRILSVRVIQPSEERWEIEAYGRFVSGEGQAYEAYLSEQFADFRAYQERYGSHLIKWSTYSTKTRSGFIHEIR